MSESPTVLLEFITRLAYNVDGLPGRLKLYFSQFITFHFSKTLSINQIEDVENKKASKSFRNDEEIAAMATKLSPDEKLWCVAAIQLLQSEAEKTDDRVISRRISSLATDLIRIFGLSESSDQIKEARSRIEAEIHQYESRPVVNIPARIWPLSLDFAIRCALLIYFSFRGLDKSSLIVLNTFLIPILIIVLVYFVGRRYRSMNSKILEVYGGAHNYKIEYRVSASQYTWLAFFLALSTFITYLLPDQLHALAFFGLTFYYFIYLRFFRVGRIEENDLVRQLENKSQTTEELNIDQNDELIVSLETKLNSFTSRLEAYVLESALFGALTFSGFLQIMASDLVSFADLENFAAGIFTTSQALIHFEWTHFEAGLESLNNKVSLFCLVSVESLVCSGFFLAVIASRLRFSDVADRVRTAINLGKAYNAKEEALYNEHERSERMPGRLAALTALVNEQLHLAALALREVNPVMAYMQYFRNAGILVFLIILISSSLFITSVLGWTFMALVGATYFYFNRKPINLTLKATYLQVRIMFIREAHWFLLVAASPFVVGMVLRNSFHWSDTGAFQALGYFFVTLYVFVWLTLAAHYDEDFGDIEKPELKARTSRWKFVKNSLASLILLYGIAMAFKSLHLAGADELAIIGMSLIAVAMYFCGYYLAKVRWLGIMCGALLAIASMGVLFKVLHLTGANELMLTAAFGLIILMWFISRKRKIFHSLFLRFSIACICIVFIFLTGILVRIDLAYGHKTFDLNRILKVVEKNTEWEFETRSGLSTAIAESDWYISTYGADVGYSFVYSNMARSYDYFCRTTLLEMESTGKKDSSMLMNALISARQRNKIMSLFSYQIDEVNPQKLGMEADILVALSKREEAIESLRKLIAKLSPGDQQQFLINKLKQLEGTASSL